MSGRAKLMWSTGAALAVAGVAWVVLGVGGGESSLGQRVNAGIDDLQAAGVRVLDLPLFMLMTGAAVVAGAGMVAAEKMAFGRLAMRRTVVGAVCVAMLLSIALIADRRIEKFQGEAISARNHATEARLSGMEGVAGKSAEASTGAAVKEAVVSVAKVVPEVTAGYGAAAVVPAAKKREATLYDREAARTYLGNYLNAPVFKPAIYDQATDLIQVKTDDPPTVAYLAIIDLTVAGVQVKTGGDLSRKTLTSEYAKRNGCSIAINGEAGRAPQANAGLGPWQGHYIAEGKVILSEVAGNPRPFLSFDKESRAFFTAMAAPGRVVPANSYNLIWGRLDALVEGQVQTVPERDRQPRTAMGINKDGTRLYLMVVDGRQQRYSVGYTRAEVGHFLKAFGADAGMLCDEGGSSCMYTSQWGIVNSPSDGEERTVYTHFGVVTPK